MSRNAEKPLIRWEPINEKIITARFKTANKCMHLNIIQCYAPTNEAEGETNESFHARLEDTIRKPSLKGVTVLMGDFNAKVGSNNTS